MGSIGSQFDPPPASSVPPPHRHLGKRIGRTAVIPFTLAGVIGIAVVTWPGAGQLATNEKPAASAAGVQEEQTAKALPEKLWLGQGLEKALLWPGIALPSATSHTPATTQQQGPVTIPPKPSAPAGGPFGIGDKLKVVVYERVDDEEVDKWGRGGDGVNGFRQRPELGGEYSIDGDGAITLPLLGQLAAAGRSPRDLEDGIAASFQKLTARNALVTIVLVERPPIYVLGPVKNPGTYKFAPGMTVLHAIALAGGFSSKTFEPWQQLEAIRENDKRRASLRSLPKLLARLAVLKSERDDATPEVSSDLLQLVGKEAAETLVAQEAERRNGIVAARQAEKDALLGSLTVAKKEMQRLATLQQPLDQLIKLRRERANAMQDLANQGTVGRQLLIQAQADLADTEQRRRDVVNQLAGATQHEQAAAQQQLARYDADIRTTLENEITALDQQISAADSDATTSLNVLNALQPAGYVHQSDAAQAHFTIVRGSTTGATEIAASGLTALEPGDLVKITPESTDLDEESTVGGLSPTESNTVSIRDTTP